MKTALIAIAVTLAVPAFAQDTGLYNRALQAYNAGDYDTSAQLFFEVNNATTDATCTVTLAERPAVGCDRAQLQRILHADRRICAPVPL